MRRLAEAMPVLRILNYIGELAQPPRIAPTREPPLWDDGLDNLRDCDALTQPDPDYVFDQQLQR